MEGNRRPEHIALAWEAFTASVDVVSDPGRLFIFDHVNDQSSSVVHY
jgi:hypothetical protein